MNKSTLHQYINGTASEAECIEVLKWASEKKENRDYLNSLINLESTLSVIDAPRASDEQFEDFIKKLETDKTSIKSPEKKFIFRKVLQYAAVLILIASVTLNIIWLSRRNVDKGSEVLVAEAVKDLSDDSELQEITVPNGCKSSIALPDGTKVILNSGSKIKFPLNFSDRSRNIAFSGEAFFDVAKDSLKPMVIALSNDYYINVLGTTFNLKSYSGEEKMSATLYTGKIRIFSATSNRSYEMRPNETITINGKDGKPKKIEEADPSAHSLWKEGILSFDETPMAEVIKSLERWHGLEIEVTDESILDYTITAKFENESATQILELLTICVPVEYSIDGNKVILTKKEI